MIGKSPVTAIAVRTNEMQKPCLLYCKSSTIKPLSHDKALFRSYGAHQVTDTTIKYKCSIYIRGTQKGKLHTQYIIQ